MAFMEKKSSIEAIGQNVIEEARMVLPGIQALFGFQLIAVFNQHFSSLPILEQYLHYGAIVLIAMSIAIIMTPAAYHRLAEQTTISAFFVSFASWLIALAMVPLATAISLELYIVGVALIGRCFLSISIAVGLFCLFATLWFALPLVIRARRKQWPSNTRN